jgi:hypothetical protein
MQPYPVILLLLIFSSCFRPDTAGSKPGDGVTDLVAGQADSLFLEEVAGNLFSQMDASIPVGKRMIEAGMAFLGTPYVAATLETEGDEKLIINMQGVDCTTFVEYVAAMALCSRRGDINFGSFARELATIRYRGGVIDGYPSRLHYFIDWLKDNESKGYIDIISNTIGNEPMDTRVYFMTANPAFYPHLENNPANIEAMAGTEEAVSQYDMRYISKDAIDKKAGMIKDGDIIAFVTAIPGLDVSHTGLAIHLNGKLHLLHASLRSKEVEITPVPLSGYLKDMKNVKGIVVARVKNNPAVN